MNEERVGVRRWDRDSERADRKVTDTWRRTARRAGAGSARRGVEVVAPRGPGKGGRRMRSGCGAAVRSMRKLGERWSGMRRRSGGRRGRMEGWVCGGDGGGWRRVDNAGRERRREIRRVVSETRKIARRARRGGEGRSEGRDGRREREERRVRIGGRIGGRGGSWRSV